jgi:tetratricopeptide (TPR) repeat protein
VVREKTKIYHDNETFLLAALRANPQIARLYSMLGNTYLRRQDIARAKEFYIKTLALDPDDFSANYMLGSLLYRAGQLDAAKIYLERIIRVKPALKLEFYPVAHAWEMLGDKQKALFYYRRALDIYPDSIEIKQKIASLENQMRPQMNPSVPPR